MTKKLISSLPPLTPVLIVDNKTGEILNTNEFKEPVKALLAYCQAETQKLFTLNKAQLFADILSYKNNANAFARNLGYASSYKTLPREVKAQSRVNELILHKLISETASYVKNPNLKKQHPTFPATLNLGAVDSQMVKLARENNELIMLWKCWDKELLLTFKLPSYLLKRDIAKFSLPLVKLDKNNNPIFIFTIQENIALRPKSQLSAGIDLGVVEPYTLAVTNKHGARIAHYSTSSRLKRLAVKQTRLRAEKNHLHNKIEAYENLGIPTKTLIFNQKLVGTATTRLTKQLALQLGAEITKKLAKHKVHILNVENLSWVSGTQKAKIGTSRWAHSQQQDAITHSTARQGILVKKVNPKNTSQQCHKCLSPIKHNAKKRTVWCYVCKSNLDRDYNAAINIANNINLTKRFPLKNRLKGNDCSSQEQVMVRKAPNSVIKKRSSTRTLT